MASMSGVGRAVFMATRASCVIPDDHAAARAAPGQRPFDGPATISGGARLCLELRQDCSLSGKCGAYNSRSSGDMSAATPSSSDINSRHGSVSMQPGSTRITPTPQGRISTRRLFANASSATSRSCTHPTRGWRRDRRSARR
jgi:hypothetical protein